MRKVRIAQIGMNRYSHAAAIFRTLSIHPEIFDLVGYALVEDERETCKDKLIWFDGYPELTLDEILNDPTIEAVAVETDEIHLLKYAQMAAEHGKHIHMEKPGSQNLVDFENLIETVRANGKVFHTGYMYRYNPYISDAIARAKAGELGTIYSVEAHMSRLDDSKCREWFGSFKGGMMFYLGCHLVDLVLQIQGIPEKVIPFNTVTGIDGILTEDLGFAVLKYPHAVSVIRTGGTEVGDGSRRQLVICGSEETLEIRPLEVGVSDDENFMLCTERHIAHKKEDNTAHYTHEKSATFQRYEPMLFAFAEIVRGEKENPYTLDYELDLFKTILRCCGINENEK